MLLPRGRPLYENLSTSFVLLDALVEHLCEEGFSGLIWIELESLSGYILINRGWVCGATIESHHAGPRSSSVSELAAAAKSQRGRIWVHSYSADTADLVSSRMAAEPLYSRLSTDFADLERLIAKLSRERDREWFIEVRAASGRQGIIHLKGEGRWAICLGDGETEGEVALEQLIRECKREGGELSVYFALPVLPEKAVTAPLEAVPEMQEELIPPEPEFPEAAPEIEELDEGAAHLEATQLMGQIASTIENAARAIEPKDTFSIYLRAGQLKVADRYPFLDPFGSEFEYAHGEILFSGEASLEELIAGFSEALRLAVTSVIEAATQPARLRARIREDLEKLLEELGPRLERFKLDKLVEELAEQVATVP
jgi:hypothetical protein